MNGATTGHHSEALKADLDTYMQIVKYMTEDIEQLQHSLLVPEGYALVPIEPTLDMLRAAILLPYHKPIYKAMLSAS